MLYQSTSIESWAKAVTPSAKLYFVRPFPGPLFNFFSSIESEISEQASWQVVTEEPEKGSSRESTNENPQRENEMDTPKVFPLSSIARLRRVVKFKQS